MDQEPFLAAPPDADKSSSSKGAGVSGTNTQSGKVKPVTPMMAQFFEIKAVNPGYLLFYRMGDFYELFFEDAEIAAAALGIALTTRGAHMGTPIPMCGVPVRAHSQYLRKLISFGHRVAICEQMEDPAEAKKRGNKSVVKRDVVRLVTPGTITEDDLLPTQANNFLGALSMLSHGQRSFSLAWADISTGETFVTDIEPDQIGDELGRLDLAELILSQKTHDDLAKNSAHILDRVRHIAVLEDALFMSELAPDVLDKAFENLNISGYSRVAQSALGALVAYVAKTQKAAGIALRPPANTNAPTHMQIDLATWSSLEVLKTNRGESKGSLRHAIDCCITAAGSRLLSRRLTTPLMDPKAINRRLDMVETFYSDSLLSQNVHDALRGLPDLTRPLTRLNLGRGGPRDMAHIAAAILSAHDLYEILQTKANLPKAMYSVIKNLRLVPLEIANQILATLIDQPPLIARDGEFVRAGWSVQLDEQRELATKSRSVIAQLQARLAGETDIKPLKIKHNKVLGFFIEVPVPYGKKLLEEPYLATFIHRQSMANAMRFTTTELSELEGQIARAQFIALEIEQEIFDKLHQKIIAITEQLRETAAALARIDVSFGLAKLAADQSYCRPKIDTSLAFNIEAGRHPVVEQNLAQNGETFVTNNCDLGEVTTAKSNNDRGQLWLVTGPNMGGKSTFLRQNALIAILAQIGAYVPARSAHIGIVDRLFSRVGASDDIARGRSTFMVEMVETAEILNRATKKSLVVLDEIGRGTATFDGLSIAWATAEALHETNGSRALFATNFHEMTALATLLERVSNHTMKAREYQGEVIFLHEVVAGAADRSYGIQVARLAGLPDTVLQRAKEILTLLESQDANKPGKFLNDLPLFSQRPAPAVQKPSAVLSLVEKLNPDELTPREAIEFMYDLKKAAHRDAKN